MGQRCLCLTAWGCLPAVLSPTLGGSKFAYTSGGSCGCACHTRPRIETFTSGGQRCLPAVLKETRLPSGGCIPPVALAELPTLFHPLIRDVYLRCYRHLPPVVSPTLGRSKFEYTSGGSCGRACNLPPIDLDLYLRCKKFSYRAQYRPLAMSERKAQGRNGYTKTAEVRGAKEDGMGASDV